MKLFLRDSYLTSFLGEDVKYKSPLNDFVVGEGHVWKTRKSRTGTGQINE